MQSHQRIRSWSAALVVAIVLSITAAAPAAAATGDDTGQRLEEARVILATGVASLSADQMAALSNTLTDALESAHFGFQTSALRLVIAYGSEVDFGRAAVIDVVRLYREHDDDRVRRMAVVALGEMNNGWGIDFLERSLRFEDSAPVRHTIAAVLAEHHAEQG